MYCENSSSIEELPMHYCKFKQKKFRKMAGPSISKQSAEDRVTFFAEQLLSFVRQMMLTLLLFCFKLVIKPRNGKGKGRIQQKGQTMSYY